MDKLEDATRRVERMFPRFTIFRRRIRLNSDSGSSLPLGAVLVFPCIVLVFIIFLFVRTPDSEGIMKMPAGTPPSIR